MDAKRYTKTELDELFPDGIPMEAAKILWESSPDKTIAEVRSELDAFIERWKARKAAETAGEKMLTLLRRWSALDGGEWYVERYAREKAELLAETRALIEATE